MKQSKQTKKKSPLNSLKTADSKSQITNNTPLIRHKTIERNLIYKHCSPLTGKENLQELVKKFQKLTIKDKKQQNRSDKESYYFINRINNINDFCCGEMCLYTHDKHQEILEMNEDDYSCDISSISPEDISILNSEEKSKASNVKKQFARSILYFLIKGNHLILAQSASIKSANLELYVNEILKKHKLINQNQYLYFKDQLNPKTIKNVNHAEYVRLFSPFKTEVTANKTDDGETFTHTLTGKMWEGIKNCLEAFGLSLNSSITLTEKLKDNGIKGEITLRFPGKKKLR